MGAEPPFEAVIEVHGDRLERLLPDEQDLDAQRPAMQQWYERLADDDVVWCIGDASGAYGLLAAERVGSDRVVVFESDERRLSAVTQALSSAGYGAVTVEPMSFLGWQRYGVTGEGVLDEYSDDPIGEVTGATDTPGRPSVLLLDVPGYGGGLLSALAIGQETSIESVLLKTTDTLAESQLAEAGFETSVVAERSDSFGPWRRAVFARRDPTAAVPSPEQTERRAEPVGGASEPAADESGSDGGQASLWARVRSNDEWRLREVGYLAVAVVLTVVSWLFLALAAVLDVIERSPFSRIAGRALVGLLIAGLFVLFLILAAVLAELGQLFGASEKAGAGAAGIAVISIPVLGALFFLKLAISSGNDR